MDLSQNATPLPFVSAYSPKNKVSITFTGPGRTKQAHKAECDINNILARFKRTGVLDFQQRMQPQYGDVSAIDFQNAQLLIARAKGMFAEMPAHLRAHFDNEPYKFLAFVNDPTNRLKAEELGLLKVKPSSQEAAAQAASTATANPPAEGATPPPATTTA